MFAGIVESTGKIVAILPEQSNVHFVVACSFVHELKIDQSIAHNGVCLTVVKIENDTYTVTAIEETLKRTNLGKLKAGDRVNLERCLRLGDRIDGHMVQGHVDTTASCTAVEDLQGSWKFHFSYAANEELATVPKGSICINGVSLTVVDSTANTFSVCIIPYTFEETNFRTVQAGDTVNLEFDIIGKYVLRYMGRKG